MNRATAIAAGCVAAVAAAFAAVVALVTRGRLNEDRPWPTVEKQ